MTKYAGALTLKGWYDIEHLGADGELKSYERILNTITSAGKAGVALLLQSSGGYPFYRFKYLALGSSATAAAVGNTALASEITSPSLDRIAGTTSRVTTNVTNDSSRVVHTWSSTATQSVQEVGLFSTATSSTGTLLSRKTFTAKNLVSGDTLQVTHTIVVA